ncbi:MAG: M50 family peptidase [Cytophagales bacterium]|nr:MAG: M50 family peptidase [Cytophagales bacterium]TAF60934.1 MAG: M50 family peptidase [Cytophagales bacterium]
MNTTIDGHSEKKSSLIWLFLMALFTIALNYVPYGNYVLYPFTILCTWFHEMGHGLTAILFGGTFHQLEIFSDGSGVAKHSKDVLFGPLGEAAVAAGGLLGPAVAGSLLIILSRSPRVATASLWILGLFMAFSVIVWVRNIFGFVFIPLWAVLILSVALKGGHNTSQFLVRLLGVQASIAVFTQFDYLFVDNAVVDGTQYASDTGAIANALLLPYWFWGTSIALVSVMMLLYSLYIAHRSPKTAA